MRGIAIITVLVVLLSGTIGYCPACDAAMEQQAPADSHACCAKSPVDVGAQMPVSGDKEPAAPSESDSDCGRMQVARILAGLDTEVSLSPVSVAPAAASAAVVITLPAVSTSQTEPILLDTSPPLTASVPLRI